jgi:hypothetical protein
LALDAGFALIESLYRHSTPLGRLFSLASLSLEGDVNRALHLKFRFLTLLKKRD